MWLHNAGERLIGCDAWYRVYLGSIGGSRASELIAAFSRSCANKNYYTTDAQRQAVMKGFAAWQPSEERSGTHMAANEQHDLRQLTIGAIVQHNLSLEGMLLNLAPAIATVISDIPLVLDTLYTDVCRVGLNLPRIPEPLRRMRDALLR